MRFTIFSILLFVLFPGNVVSSAETKVLLGGTVVDLDGQANLEDAVVLIKGERIAAIGGRSEITIPANAEVIDTQGLWLIPGLMNMHVHMGLVLPGKMAAEHGGESEADLVLRMAAFAEQILQAGVTTIRSPGNSWPPRILSSRPDIALQEAIKNGTAHGPRIFSAGEALRITGGHGSRPGETYNDGPVELIEAARREISLGASWIKIMISGGIATQGGNLSAALMTPEEIKAVVDAAHRFGARITAHSGSSEATSIAVDAGIDCIEHGYFLDRNVLKKMKKRGTWLVPTIVVSQPATAPFFEKIGSPDWYLKRRDSAGKEHWKALKMAIEEDVNIALGTDQLPSEPNDGTTATAREAQYYVEAGMTPLQALRSATIAPAQMLGADNDIGSLEVGKYADIVILAVDPVEDIKALRDILLVMKGGEIYRNELAN